MPSPPSSDPTRHNQVLPLGSLQITPWRNAARETEHVVHARDASAAPGLGTDSDATCSMPRAPSGSVNARILIWPDRLDVAMEAGLCVLHENVRQFKDSIEAQWLRRESIGRHLP